MQFKSFKSLLAIVALAAAGVAGAQTAWPSKPIRVLVPILPGGAPDIAARVWGQALSEALKQPVVIENKPGSNGNIAGDTLAKAPADGYTLLLAADSGIVINPHVYKNMPFDPLKDFVPVATVASNQFVLAVNPKLPVQNFHEFMEYAKKANPPLYYASGGNGSQHHLMMEMLKQRSGVNMVHVPYKSGSAATVGTVAGDTSVMFAGSSNAGQIKSGKLRPLAVTSSKRAPEYPDLPAIAEEYPGYEGHIWLGVFAPAGTPPAVVERLREETAKILKQPAIRERFATAGGMEPFATTPQEFDALIKRDYEKFGRIVKQINLKID